MTEESWFDSLQRQEISQPFRGSSSPAM